MPEIVVKFEDKILEKFVTEKKRVTIGRTADNDIVLENKAISRRHAIIEFNEDSAIIMDNESLNGTFVNSRKINEEILKDNDVVTIGKYSLIYHRDVDKNEQLWDLTGTMILETRKQKEMLAKDKIAKELTSEAGCSILLGEAGAEQDKYALAHSVVTIGKSKLANIRAKGWFLSGIQAKVVKDGADFWIVNLGRKGMAKVNGEIVDNYMLKNDDIIQVGKTVFRFLENRSR